jgi:hypothetical protein
MLKSLVIVCGRGCFESRAELNSKLRTLFAGKRAGKCYLPQVYVSACPEGGYSWNLQRASHFSRDDPFDYLALA